VRTRNVARPLTWVDHRRYNMHIFLSVRGEQEHGHQNYGHADKKLHFGRFLQHIKIFFLEIITRKWEYVFNSRLQLISKSVTFNMLPYIIADKKILIQCIES